jgi:predicted lipid-binding transport protein (Tim44 family)
MGEFQYFDIILFAMVAAFLVLRLRSVLGRRTGNERRRDLFVRRARPAPDKAPPSANRATAWHRGRCRATMRSLRTESNRSC